MPAGGATTRQGERLPGTICPDTLAKHIVQWNLQDLERVFHGAIRAVAQAGVFGAKVTGIADGTTLWWLDQHGLRFVVPAQSHMAVVADARAPAAACAGIPGGRRVHTVRHGQGKTARTERLETEVVGITGLTTDDQYRSEQHGCQAKRGNCQANSINAVVVRQWQGKDYGPGGKTVFVTNAPVAKPLQPFDDDDDCSPIENCGLKEAKQQWELGHSPQKSDRAVRVHVVFTL